MRTRKCDYCQEQKPFDDVKRRWEHTGYMCSDCLEKTKQDDFVEEVMDGLELKGLTFEEMDELANMHSQVYNSNIFQLLWSKD